MKRADAAAASHSMSKHAFNPFDILGLEPTFDIEPTTLEMAYFTRQATAHPDRFVHHSEPERQAAAAQSSSLNQAYNTLKNPMLRAKALLQLRGLDISGEEEKTVQNPTILEEMMVLKEKLSNAVSPYDVGDVKSQAQKRFESVKASFCDAIRTHHDDKLPGLFLQLTYLSKLMDDIKACQRQSSIKAM